MNRGMWPATRAMPHWWPRPRVRLGRRPGSRQCDRAKTAPKGAPTAPRGGQASKGNIFGRFGRFLREVVAELRKVIWPTRKEMVTYTIVVIVFVVFMVALVAGLDVLFAKGVLAVFG